MIGRRGKPYTAADRTARCRIPGDVNIIAERTVLVYVRRDHRLVVEMVRAALKSEEIDTRIALTAVGRSRHGDFCAIDPRPIAEKHDDVTIEKIALAIEGERWIGAEIDPVCSDRWWQG